MSINTFITYLYMRETKNMGEQKSDVFSDNFGASEMKFPEREFQRMKKLAEENMQPTPYNYFQDGNSFWAEVEGRNPIFLCRKTEKGWVNFEKGVYTPEGEGK